MPHHLAEGSDFPPIEHPEKLRFYDMVFCPFSMRVKLVLDYHKFDYEQIYINLKSKPEWFTNRFPTGKVPAIEQNGEKMVESDMICLFLDQMHPENSLFNVSGQEKIDAAKGWWGKMMPAFYHIGFMAEFTEDKKQTYFECLTEFEDLCQGPFLSGSKVGLADFLIFPQLDRIEAYHRIMEKPMPTEAERPRLLAFLKAMRDLPSVAEHRIDADRYYRYSLSSKAKANDYDI